MKLTKLKSKTQHIAKRITSAATRRKRLSSNVRKKILWRQRSCILTATTEHSSPTL
ncbi:hypothetical protein [Photobacterium aquimaris]|uniref:Uncharacterized protein n=1 Tax=Photobacterium aquimaris TaxID=512643 RepID=A0A1Y6KRI2_9GAMM|nr:hypothetical protein [Photobacterium aquimaris]SMY14789.1 hypothetical protein PAQU9191_00003 [Photobacterium aquimaris]